MQILIVYGTSTLFIESNVNFKFIRCSQKIKKFKLPTENRFSPLLGNGGTFKTKYGISNAKRKHSLPSQNL